MRWERGGVGDGFVLGPGRAGAGAGGYPTRMGALYQTDLALPGLRRGKVRDVYEMTGGPAAAGAGGQQLLIVATDRISAVDVVMPTPIPGKGRLLTALSSFWLRFIERRGVCRTHLLSDDASDIPPAAFKQGGTAREQLAGRVTIARK